MKFFKIDKRDPPKLFSFKINEYINLTFQGREFFHAIHPIKLTDVVYGTGRSKSDIVLLLGKETGDNVFGLIIKEDHSFTIGLFKNLKYKRINGYLYQGEIKDVYLEADDSFCARFVRYILDYVSKLKEIEF